MIKKFTTILLPVIFLHASTELHQLWQLPELVAHYRDHCRQDDRLSLLEFLGMHYPGPGYPDDDEEEDNRLPFRSIGVLTHTDTPVLTREEVLTNPFVLLLQHKPVLLAEAVPERTPVPVFHPPRIRS